MNFSQFKTILTLRIDWSDLDHFRHVNNIAFMRYIQSARVNYWERTGITDYYDSTGIGPILLSAHFEFKFPLHYPGTVEIRTYCSQLNNSSFHLDHVMFDNEQNLCATGKDILVYYDFNKNEKQVIPGEIRVAIENLEDK